MTPAVELESLTKVYDRLWRTGLRAVDGVSLRVEPGTVFGLLGPNGAGKSTLVKMVLSVVRPTAGTARILGRSSGQPAARQHVGFLPEQLRLPDFLNARQFLRLMASLSGVSISRRRIHELLERVRLDRFPGMTLRKYSKGMQQRLGLAQALLHDPVLLFLDEPTEGVDPLGRKEFRDLLLDLKAQGKTIFLNSHLLSEVEQVCDRIVILNHGRVVREGTVAEFTQVQGSYRLRVSEATRTAAVNLLGPASADGEFILRASDLAELNRWIDRLRAAAVEIESLTPARGTLEDFFIQVIQE